jgi:hypothetical protein
LLDAGGAACPTQGFVSSSSVLALERDCLIDGEVSLSGTSTLSMKSGVLTVRGQVVLGDDATLTVVDGGLVFPQTDYSQYSVTLRGRSALRLTRSGFVTNGTSANNFSMSLEAHDQAEVSFDESRLDTNGGSWLLGNFHGHSKLNMVRADNLPTEVYPSEAASVSISSGSNFATVWLEFMPGSSGVVTLPTREASGNYSLSFGPTTGFDASVNITNSAGRLGLNSHPGSDIVVNGTGASGTRDVDVVFGYYVRENTSDVSISGLTGGPDVTRTFTDQGRRLQLNHVNLNPFSWQVYVSNTNGHVVQISNSKINEIAALPHATVNISNSVLQLAVVGAFGPGAVMNIDGTQLWVQAMLAQGGGQVAISNSQIHGNYFAASGAGSKIVLTNVGESRNAVPPQSCMPVDGYPPNVDGVPLCNPLNPPYRCSQIVPPTGGAVFSATPALTCP